ncbi:MAG TPA: zinc ribbon domain-containing protein [Polyangiaceae bacterium]
MTQHRCQSCGMPIETGRYCQYCVTEDGRLDSFESRLEKMMAFFMGQDKSLDRAEAERRTRAYLSTMPAWKDHPALKS